MKIFTVITAFLIALTGNAFASEYNYITPETLKNSIEGGKQMLIVDIQVKDEFEKHHIKGSLPTYAYPAKNENDTTKLDVAISKQQETNAPVVIVCPRGKGGAKRSYDYLKAKGVEGDKLLILEKGMDGWPYAELTTNL